ncbi:MAG: dynamin family protein [Ruminococcus sp.]|nr:dynamin family protein [Ruminococcus sp.]
MAKVINPDFFRKTEQTQPAKPQAVKVQTEEIKKEVNKVKPATPPATGDRAQKSSEKKQTPSASKENIFTSEKLAPLKINSALSDTLREIAGEFRALGNEGAAKAIESVYVRGTRNRFSVAVVGEFSRGKSTFINNLLGREILPVGDLPTTALLTRIRFNNVEKLVHFNQRNQKVADLPLSQDSWDGLVAENFGKSDPTGTVFAGVKSEWLGRNNIEIMDTPGAGDLEAKRARIIGDALLGCDGAIITVTATGAMSMSEKLFIEQRLLSRKTPFMMLIITKLDLIRKAEREKIIQYVQDKLTSWNMNIPVFIPAVVDGLSEKYKDIMGLDKIKAKVVSWMNDKERVKMTEEWIATQALEVVDRELSVLYEQKALLEADEQKREELIEEKKNRLKKAELAWEDIRIKMLSRGKDCYDQLIRKAAEYRETITERLQYEVSHTPDPARWWQDDYTYRLKVELANMAVGIENTISRVITEDMRWFNSVLENSFKTHVICEKETIADRDLVKDVIVSRELDFEDIGKKRNAVRVGTAALSIAGYALCSSVGFLPLIATMGVSTGSSIVSEKVFKKKIDEQRALISEALATEVPRAISEATAESERRIKAVYDDIIKAAKEKEEVWTQAQLTAIENGNRPQDPEKAKEIFGRISKIVEFVNKLQAT